jgi:predicted DNA-binding protein YlxM (UPF0122 family)
MMVAIKNPILKKQFEQFSKLGPEAGQKAFWESFSKDFDSMSEEEQENMRQAWMENMENVEKRLKDIGKKLDNEVAEISVFPANAEEAQLIEALLSRMNVRYNVA